MGGSKQDFLFLDKQALSVQHPPMHYLANVSATDFFKTPTKFPGETDYGYATRLAAYDARALRMKPSPPPRVTLA